MLKPLALLAAVMLLFSSCEKKQPEGPPYSGKYPMGSDEQVSETMFETILIAMENRDSDTIKVLFSERALKEAENLDEAIEYLFNLFDGEVVSWEMGTANGGQLFRNGRHSKLIQAWFTVHTAESKYLFLLLNYHRNTIDPDLKGLYTLHGIDDANENAIWSDWVAMKIPGVYMPGDTPIMPQDESY